MDKSVLIATSYPIILTNLYLYLREKGFTVVGLVTRSKNCKELNVALNNIGMHKDKVFEIPTQQGAVSIQKAMDSDPDYKSKVEKFIANELVDDFDYLVSWGINVLPSTLVNKSRVNSINVHPSSLPKYRGGFPFQAQIINKEPYLRVTIHKTTEKVDCGDVYYKSEPIKIDKNDTMSSLVAKVVPLGAQYLSEVLCSHESGRVEQVNIEKLQSFPHAWGVVRNVDPKNNLFKSNSGVLGFYNIKWDMDDIESISLYCKAFDMMGYPFTSIAGLKYHIKSIETINHSLEYKPGLILGCFTNCLHVQTITGVASVEIKDYSFEEFASLFRKSENISFDNSVKIEHVINIQGADR